VDAAVHQSGARARVGGVCGGGGGGDHDGGAGERVATLKTGSNYNVKNLWLRL
jgi:hypothetical protein